MSDPLGFVVTCSRPIDKAPYAVKVYSINKVKLTGKVVFRFYKKWGEFPEHALAAEAASDYAKLHEFPFVYSKALHNHRAPAVVYKWYFKDPPVKMLESVFK